MLIGDPYLSKDRGGGFLRIEKRSATVLGCQAFTTGAAFFLHYYISLIEKHLIFFSENDFLMLVCIHLKVFLA